MSEVVSLSAVRRTRARRGAAVSGIGRPSDVRQRIRRHAGNRRFAEARACKYYCAEPSASL